MIIDERFLEHEEYFLDHEHINHQVDEKDYQLHHRVVKFLLYVFLVNPQQPNLEYKQINKYEIIIILHIILSIMNFTFSRVNG